MDNQHRIQHIAYCIQSISIIPPPSSSSTNNNTPSSILTSIFNLSLPAHTTHKKSSITRFKPHLNDTVLHANPTRLSLDPTHLPFLQQQFHSCHLIRDYLNKTIFGNNSTYWGLNWFRSTGPPVTEMDQLLLFIYQSLEQLKYLRVTHMANKRFTINDESDFADSNSVNNVPLLPITYLQNLSSIEFKGVSPTCLDLSDMSLHINTLIVQAQLDSMEQALGSTLWPNLSVLDLSNNCLKSIDLSTQAQNLTELILHNNMLNQVPDVLALVHLTYMDLSYNQITYLPDSSVPHVSLLRLNMHNNQLANVSNIPKLFPNLTQLIISKNELTELPSLHGLASLADLQIWGNSFVCSTDDSAFRQELESCLNRVEHIIVDGVRLVPLPDTHQKRKKVRSRVVQLDSKDHCNNPFPNSPYSNTLSVFSSTNKFNKVKSPELRACSPTTHASIDATSFPPLTKSDHQPRSRLNSPTLIPTSQFLDANSNTNGLSTSSSINKDLVRPYIHGFYDVVESDLAKQRLRSRVDELKKLSGSNNWMAHLIHETKPSSTPKTIGSPNSSHVLVQGLSSYSGSEPDAKSLALVSKQARQLSVTSDILLQSSTSDPAVTMPLGTPPRSSIRSGSTPYTQWASLGHSDSGIAGNRAGVPHYEAQLAMHTKPVQLTVESKRSSLVYEPFQVSDTLVELGLNDALAAQVVYVQQDHAYMQISFRASRNSPLRYWTIKYSGPSAHDHAQQWACTLDIQLKSKWTRGHYDDVCTRAECVVCMESGFVNDLVGHSESDQDDSSQLGSDQDHVWTLDPRREKYLDVQVRHPKPESGKYQIECRRCSTVVSVYNGQV